MSWDIYGEPLRRGHCEVHPHVHEEYPCSVCISEKQAWDQAQAAMLAAAPTAPADAEEIHVNVEGDSVYTLPLEPTGMAAPRFVVHVPAPDEREIAALREDAERYRWLCDGNGYFLEEEMLCGYENQKQAADRAIDAERLCAGKEGG